MSGPIESRVFAPLRIGPLTLSNRVLRTAAFEGMCPGGLPSRELVGHHREMAEGGVAMTTVAYCAVSPDGRTYEHQLLASSAIAAGLRRLTDSVHSEGAAASIQLGHCGDFSNPRVIGGRPPGPSRRVVLYGLTVSRAMTRDDAERITGDFVSAARLAAKSGFDAVEIHAGHGYLLSQFLCPRINRRGDELGRSPEGRVRFPAEVVRRVRDALPARVAVLVKINAKDGFPGGLEPEGAALAARAFEKAGADALVISGGFVSREPLYMLRGNVPTREMAAVQGSVPRRIGLRLFGRLFVPRHEFEELFFMEPARPIGQAVSLPLVLAGGVCSLSGMESALEAGFEAFAVGRALVRDPRFVRRMSAGEIAASDCDHCNRCIAEMDRGGLCCTTAAEERLSRDRSGGAASSRRTAAPATRPE